jgi:hypothetical protein
MDTETKLTQQDVSNKRVSEIQPWWISPLSLYTLDLHMCITDNDLVYT